MKIKFIIAILIGILFSGCVGVSSKGIFGTGVSVLLLIPDQLEHKLMTLLCKKIYQLKFFY